MNKISPTTPLVQPSKPEAVDSVLIRNAYYISIMLVVASIPSVGLFVYYGLQVKAWQVLAVAAIMFVASLGSVGAIILIRRNRSNLAMMIIITSFMLTFITIPFFIKDLGIILAITFFILSVAITGLAMPTRYAISGLLVGLFSSILILFLDYVVLSSTRIRVPGLERATIFIVIGFAGFFAIFTARHFDRFSLRIKITISILLTGGAIVTALTLFSFNRASTIINSLNNQFEKEATENIKEQLIETTREQAIEINQLFSSTANDLVILSDYRASLEQQSATLALNQYWDAATHLIQYPGGQYGNSSTDVASIFIPSIVLVDETVYSRLNTSSYLDFFAPNFLKAHPLVAAVYFIDTGKATTYYPNINLAQNTPASFDPTRESFYTIAMPENNPSREPRWTSVYQDPAGQGLVTTLSIPVYSNDTFLGVVGADIKLEQISRTIANVQIGDTGYAFLVDQAGHILSMPQQGYDLYNISPEDPSNPIHEVSVLAKGPFDVQEATSRMINGENSISSISIDNANSFFIFAPIATPNYRIGIIAPEKEFTSKLQTSRDEIQKNIQSTLQGITIILFLLLIGAIIVSLWLGQIITQPLVRLTQIAEKIASGNFTARANIETQDETGTLAKSFNSMAERLSDTLLGLETSVLDRTRELEAANTNIARRAGQFEIIANIARTISSAPTLDALLPRIVDTISEQFGFYHVGIFLLDSHREYAILEAANSDGGKRMLARNHRLLVGGTGIVGFVTNSGEPRVALDVGQDAAFFNNPDLPETHSEIALPLLSGNEVIGALDVQSMEINAFSQEDVSILSALADQVSIAIQNARSYQKSQESIKQAEAASMQMSEVQWGRFLTEQQTNSYVFDGIDAKNIQMQTATDENTLVIPLVLRGTRIGTLKLNPTNPNRVWTDDELAMANATAERTAFALENARLLQEAQKRAAKERAIGQITASISGLVNIENILQTSIQELGNTLPNTDIAIQISDQPEPK